VTFWRYYLLASTPALVLAAVIALTMLFVGLPGWFATEVAAAIILGAVFTVVAWHLAWHRHR
jgi:hypothetical protein